MGVIRWWLLRCVPLHIRQLGDDLAAIQPRPHYDVPPRWLLNAKKRRGSRPSRPYEEVVEQCKNLPPREYLCVGKYLIMRYNAPFLLPPRQEEPTFKAADCPKCGPTTIRLNEVGLWDGVDADGNDTGGITEGGPCQKCGAFLERYDDGPWYIRDRAG